MRARRTLSYEGERAELVADYHRRARVKLPNARLHAAMHVIVENQLAEGIPAVAETLQRLRAEGLERHVALHAIGSVLIKHVWTVLRDKPPEVPDHEPYFAGLRQLSAAGWRAEAD
jgi:hypothetical protein